MSLLIFLLSCEKIAKYRCSGSRVSLTMTDAVAGHLELEVLRLLDDLEEGRGNEDVVDPEY